MITPVIYFEHGDSTLTFIESNAVPRQNDTIFININSVRKPYRVDSVRWSLKEWSRDEKNYYVVVKVTPLE
jgi:hypothetical protein